jgi:hypothetical protein
METEEHASAANALRRLAAEAPAAVMSAEAVP